MKTTKLIVLYYICAVLFCTCATVTRVEKTREAQNDPLLQAGTQEQKDRFIKCSENEGDQGCDSCYYLVYGRYSGF